MYKRIVLLIVVLIVLLLITIPLAIYSYSLSMLDSMPLRPQNITVTNTQLIEQWAVIEPKVALEKVGSITPYWIYTWRIATFLNDPFSSKNLDPYDRISAMASEIAIHHMKETKVGTNSKLWWQLLHANLAIWLQRNWLPSEILIKYKTL